MPSTHYIRTEQELQHLAHRLITSKSFRVDFLKAGSSESRRRAAIRNNLSTQEVCSHEQIERMSRAIAETLEQPASNHCHPGTSSIRDVKMAPLQLLPVESKSAKESIPPLIPNTEGKHMPYSGKRMSNIRLRGLTEAQLSTVEAMVREHKADCSVTLAFGGHVEVFINCIKGLELPDKLLAFAKLHELQYDATIESAEHPPTFAFGRLENNTPNLQQIPKKANTMTTTPIITITTKTLINDQDAKMYSDAELYELIRKEEVKIEELDKIKNKPKKLVVEIEKRKTGIKALVEFMDSRDEKSAN